MKGNWTDVRRVDTVYDSGELFVEGFDGSGIIKPDDWTAWRADATRVYPLATETTEGSEAKGRDRMSTITPEEVPKPGPLDANEAEEMVRLFRVVRAENDRPGEREKLARLMQRWEMFNEPEIRKRKR